MGQKVNPRGLRLGVVATWDSRWMFANKKNYRDTLLTDIKLREEIFKKFKFSDVTQIEIERAINKILIIIHSVKPGVIIGRGGRGLEDIKNYITDIIGREKVKKEKMKIELKIEPVKKAYLNALYVAYEIGQKLMRNMPHRIIVHHAMEKILGAGARGVKVQLGGRIGGASISRREKYYEGTVPLSTIREDIDFARYPALTKSGYIGVKVWIAR